MIIDSEGKTVHEDSENGKDEIRENPVSREIPQLEILVPDSERIAQEQAREQLIIARILGNPLY